MLLCNGQFYYDLKEKRDEFKRKVILKLFRILLLLEYNKLLHSLLNILRKYSLFMEMMLNIVGPRKSMRIMELGISYTLDFVSY